ncbi:hypothetical protein [Pseudomonas lactucae]|uniref:hypothetical protein n=1 Tax=Pseudomonas lactucae TaxID=2813360 RepID=UPI003CC5DCCD
MAASNKWLMSSVAYYLDFFTIPLFIGFALWLAPLDPWQLLAGLLAWTLVEYSAHRFLFHSLYRREHWTHHIDVLAYIGVSSWKTSTTFAALLLFAWYTGLTSAFIGAVTGYFYYISVHYVMHAPRIGRTAIFRGWLPTTTCITAKASRKTSACPRRCGTTCFAPSFAPRQGLIPRGEGNVPVINQTEGT